MPKDWYEKEIYCQLLPNDDDDSDVYDMIPRIGAFEVSLVVDDVDILLYSKMICTLWPNVEVLGQRISQLVDA